MKLPQKILQKVTQLPEAAQAEVLDFVDFIESRKGHSQEAAWHQFSLAGAMRGMKDEAASEYTAVDLKEPFA